MTSASFYEEYGFTDRELQLFPVNRKRTLLDAAIDTAILIGIISFCGIIGSII